MRVVVNGVSAKMGGAATYVRALAGALAATPGGDEFLLLVPPERAAEIRDLPPRIRVEAVAAAHTGFFRRMWFEQVTLRRALRQERADVLFSSANLAMFRAPCRQAVLMRNALYFSELFAGRFLQRMPLRRRIEFHLRRILMTASARAADVVMTPSAAMARELIGRAKIDASKVVVNHYGVAGRFRSDATRQIAHGPAARLLFSSLYAEYKNLGTLLRALTVLADAGHDFRLVTAADPTLPDARYTTTWEEDSQLARDPRLASRITFTRKSPGEDVAALYGEADVFCYPSVVESFGHPLAEAMAAGLPIVAADVPINRELCGDAAVYFSPFDAEDCARQLQRVLGDANLRRDLGSRAAERSRQFSWEEHVRRLLEALGASNTAVRECEPSTLRPA